MTSLERAQLRTLRKRYGTTMPGLFKGKSMYQFNVTITTLMGRHRIRAIAKCAADLVDAAIDMFGVCGVTVVLV